MSKAQAVTRRCVSSILNVYQLSNQSWQPCPHVSVLFLFISLILILEKLPPLSCFIHCYLTSTLALSIHISPPFCRYHYLSANIDGILNNILSLIKPSHIPYQLNHMNGILLTQKMFSYAMPRICSFTLYFFTTIYCSLRPLTIN